MFYKSRKSPGHCNGIGGGKIKDNNWGHDCWTLRKQFSSVDIPLENGHGDMNYLVGAWCQIDKNLTTWTTAGSGQREPPRLVLEVEGDSNFAGSHAWEAEVPPLQSSKKEGFQLSWHCRLQSWSPPHFKHKSGGFTLAWPSCIYIFLCRVDIWMLTKQLEYSRYF